MKILRQELDEHGYLGNVAFCRHEREDKVAADFPGDDMSNRTRFRRFVVTVHVGSFHKRFQNRDEFFRPCGVNGAGIHGHDAVAVLGVEADDVLAVFIHADIEKRVERVAARNNISETEARKLIRNTDKHRAAYYEMYTDKEWGSPNSYHLCVDSGAFGLGGTAELLKNCVQAFGNRS